MEIWKFDGLDLNTLANIVNVAENSHCQIPPNSQKNGYKEVFRKGEISLVFWLKTQNSSSESASKLYYEERKDALVELFSKPGLHILEQTLDGRTMRLFTCEVRDLSWCTSTSYRWIVLSVDLIYPEAFWSQPILSVCTIKLKSTVQNTTVLNLNTIPNNYVKITLTGTLTHPKIINQTNGTWISLNYALKDQQQLVVESDPHSITLHNIPLEKDLITFRNSQPILNLSPGENSINIICEYVKLGTLKIEFRWVTS